MSNSGSSPLLVPRPYPFGATVLPMKLNLPGLLVTLQTLADYLPKPKNNTNNNSNNNDSHGNSNVHPASSPPKQPLSSYGNSSSVGGVGGGLRGGLQPRNSNMSSYDDLLVLDGNKNNLSLGPPVLPPLQQGSSYVNSNNNMNTQSDQMIHYTVWITCSWWVLGWAEPCASVFWEMATMFHTLYLAGRRGTIPTHNFSDFRTSSHPLNSSHSGKHNRVPSIGYCGSNVSEKSFGSERSFATTSHYSHVSGKQNVGNGADGIFRGGGSGASSPVLALKTMGQRSRTTSAKELPLWLIGLCLFMYVVNYKDNNNGDTGGNQKSVASGILNSNDRFFSGLNSVSGGAGAGGNDLTSLVLEHIRLLLIIVSNPHDDAVRLALEELQTQTMHPGKARPAHGYVRRVKMSLEEIERLNFIFQRPYGGSMEDDSSLSIASILLQDQNNDTSQSKIPIIHVEDELRRCLEDSVEVPPINTSMSDQGESITEDKIISSLSANMAQINLQGPELGEKKAVKIRRSMSLDSNYSEDSRSAVLFHARPNTELKEICYVDCNRTTIILRPDYDAGPDTMDSSMEGSSEGRGTSSSQMCLHDLNVACCSDVHMYLLQPFEQAIISGCHNCTIVIGAVAGLLHIVNCDRVNITSASRRVIVRDCHEVTNYLFSPSPPLLVGDVKTCQFAPYNTYYDGLREDLLATGLAALGVQSFLLDLNINNTQHLHLQCASNKWNSAIDTSLLETPVSPLKNASNSRSENVVNEDAIQHKPMILPASEFHPIFVPLGDNSAEITGEKGESEDGSSANENKSDKSVSSDENPSAPKMGSRYSRALSDMLQMIPFKMPSDYERRIITGIERVKNVQYAMTKKVLSFDQNRKIEEELNRRFREWLVSSSNLRQVLDLAHLEE